MSSHIWRTERTPAAFILLVITLCFAPLAFGTTETWSMLTVELLVSLTGLLCFFPFSADKTDFYLIPGQVPLLLFLCWMCFQCIPLPVALVRLISPNTVAVYQPILDLQAPGTWIPLTLNRQASLLECLRLSSYALFYVLTVQLLSRSSGRLAAAVHAVAGLCLLTAFLSVFHRFTAPDTLFWFRKLASGHGSFGPWVYKNHYAGFMVMTSPLVLALFFLHRPTAGQGLSCREKFVSLFSGPEANIRLLLGFGAMVALSSIFLSGSRGGIISICCAVLLLFSLLARQQGRRQTLSLLVLLCGLGLMAGWFSWATVIDRFEYILDPATGGIRDDRLLIWQDTLRIIADFLATGSGFGTFLEVFPEYKTFSDNLIYDHVHNDYLELLADGGLIGFILMTCFVGTVLVTGLRRILSRRDRLALLPSIGAFSGIVGILVYSLTDFNLHNGANGLYFFFFCGLLVAAGHTRRQHRSRPSLLTPAASAAGCG